MEYSNPDLSHVCIASIHRPALVMLLTRTGQKDFNRFCNMRVISIESEATVSTCRVEQFIPLSLLLGKLKVNATALDALTWKMTHPSTEEASLLSSEGIKVDLVRSTYGEERIISTPSRNMWSYHFILSGEMITPIPYLFTSLSIHSPNTQNDLRFTNTSVVLRVQIADIDTSSDVDPFEIVDLRMILEEAPGIMETFILNCPQGSFHQPFVLREFKKGLVSAFDKHGNISPPGKMSLSLNLSERPSRKTFYEGGGLYLPLDLGPSSQVASFDGKPLESGQLCIVRPNRLFEYQCQPRVGIISVSPFGVDTA